VFCFSQKKTKKKKKKKPFFFLKKKNIQKKKKKKKKKVQPSPAWPATSMAAASARSSCRTSACRWSGMLALVGTARTSCVVRALLWRVLCCRGAASGTRELLCTGCTGARGLGDAAAALAMRRSLDGPTLRVRRQSPAEYRR
jgi:hypothetical protein